MSNFRAISAVKASFISMLHKQKLSLRMETKLIQLIKCPYKTKLGAFKLVIDKGGLSPLWYWHPCVGGCGFYNKAG